MRAERTADLRTIVFAHKDADRHVCWAAVVAAGRVREGTAERGAGAVLEDGTFAAAAIDIANGLRWTCAVHTD